MNDLFEGLVDFYGARPDKRMEVHVPCPACQKQPVPGQTHFSFNESGGFCFVCSYSVSLRQLATDCKVGNGFPSPSRRPWQSKRRYPWRDFTEALAKGYAASGNAVEAWQEYKPLHRETIIARVLGIGRFPPITSRCGHQRLMVPFFSGGLVVGFRGRAVACDCGKWLSPSGSRIVLYNGGRLLPPESRNRNAVFSLGDCPDEVWARKKLLIIVENPIDALLIEEKTRHLAVATLGVSMWRQGWTKALKRAKPETVIIAFDNDLPGNGGAKRRKEFAAKWKEQHSVPPPEPAAERLRRRLADAEIKAWIYDWGWAEEKADVGLLFQNKEKMQL